MIHSTGRLETVRRREVAIVRTIGVREQLNGKRRVGSIDGMSKVT